MIYKRKINRLRTRLTTVESTQITPHLNIAEIITCYICCNVLM